MLVKVLHNGNCSKSNAVLEYLDENGVHFEIINIIEDPLSVLEIKTVLKKLNQSVFHIIRKTDKLYVEEYADKNYSEEEWIKILSENPSLIQRPILVKGSVAMLGRPIENVKFFISSLLRNNTCGCFVRNSRSLFVHNFLFSNKKTIISDSLFLFYNRITPSIFATS
ncbi:ArsC/Spx/MgsR family protein [Chryseobacterium sp. Marseille-Q3244]|uniref:ArsC/Spx/MgsR family protein n=1 Tax=Chryseobacterium sp. Marseille-Q3244 TaxID=2758092 RepID=UPI00202503B3|nr:ArsC/Spx/MgsR family protein [Chryseobacterium sp. Marseille-Q3244]